MIILIPIKSQLVGDSNVNIWYIIEKAKSVIFIEQSIQVKLDTREFLNIPKVLNSLPNSNPLMHLWLRNS